MSNTTELHTIRFGEMTRHEIQAIARDGLIVLPIGSTEQHGPHLPVQTDAMTVEHIAMAAAESVAGRIPIAVAPTLPFGCSEHHLPFGGTLSLRSTTLLEILMDLGSSLVKGGAKQIFIVNGHGGNHELMEVAARDLALQNDVRVAAASYWNICREELIALGAREHGRFPGHAGAFETSIVLSIAPDLQHEPLPNTDHRAPDQRSTSAMPGFRSESHGSWQATDGYTNGPHLASKHRGEQFVEASIRGLAASFEDFCLPRESATQ